MRGLLVDYGGVLTSNVFDSFRDFCDARVTELQAMLRKLPGI